MEECQWFLNCHNPATADVEHPSLGWVPTCATHLTWLKADLSPEGRINPTKLVPPMVAARGTK